MNGCIPKTVRFDYVHPLSVPSITPRTELIRESKPLRVEAKTILRFGFMEGDAVVEGDRVVFDPQSATQPKWFGANGSQAKELAVVINGYESRLLTGEADPEKAAQVILEKAQATVVVLKRGSRGALVLTDSLCQEVPAYQSRSVFKIGSGDVFSAAFTYYWAELDLDPARAADLASKSTARYCESRAPNLLRPEQLDSLDFERAAGTPGHVYLAGPFFSLGSRWLVEEARARLREMELEVFSPVHDIGPGEAHVVAPADLDGLERSDRMLALLDGADPGTMFEVGYARARDIPVIAYSEALPEEDLKMVVGSGCKHTDDFATALYLVSWLGT